MNKLGIIKGKNISELKSGWNTWNTRSVLSHVLLPESFAVSLGIKSYHSGHCLREPLIGRRDKNNKSGTAGPSNIESIMPGPHAYDGSFTSLELDWDGVEVRVETAADDTDWYIGVNADAGASSDDNFEFRTSAQELYGSP